MFDLVSWFMSGSYADELSPRRLSHSSPLAISHNINHMARGTPTHTNTPLKTSTKLLNSSIFTALLSSEENISSFGNLSKNYANSRIRMQNPHLCPDSNKIAFNLNRCK